MRDGTAGGGERGAVDAARVFRLWFPLASSWLLMACEPALVIRAMSSLAEPKVNLAAWSSIVFPISLVFEGPIMMILAASTALSSDLGRYRQVGRYTQWLAGGLTLGHALVAFTPLYDWVARDVIGSSAEVAAEARPALQWMLPWTFAIAWRRYQQGLLIRMEHSGDVGRGTALRLAATGTVLVAGTLHGGLAGVVVAALGVSTGVIAEALYASARARRLLARLAEAERDEPLTRRGFFAFYVPLALTPLVLLFVQPIGAAAMNRMPESLDSLAAFGAVTALVFLSRSVGMAFNEVVVSLAGKPGGPAALRRFGVGLALATTGSLALVAATPLALAWFGVAQGLPPDLSRLARVGVLLSLALPSLQVAQSWFQGRLVHSRRTRAITEAVVLNFAVAFATLQLGVSIASSEPGGVLGLGPVAGLHWTVGCFVAAASAQTAWLWWRCRRLA